MYCTGACDYENVGYPYLSGYVYPGYDNGNRWDDSWNCLFDVAWGASG